MEPTAERHTGVHATGLPDQGRDHPNRGALLAPEKKSAEPAGPRNDGKKDHCFEIHAEPRQEQRRKAEPVARVRLIPAWNDDQHLTGWTYVSDAVANVLDAAGG